MTARSFMPTMTLRLPSFGSTTASYVLLVATVYITLSVWISECVIRDEIVFATDNFWSSQHQSSLQSPPSSRNNTTSTILADDNVFSACLLTMDDSHFLIEWIAYHYHTLPLRNLIVAVDPYSKTSPSAILDKWRQHGMMNITEWKDEDYMPPPLPKPKTTKYHRIRQRYFMKQCMSTLKHKGAKWVLMLDVDEYLTFNIHTETLNTSLQDPGSIMKFLNTELQRNDTKLQTGACIVIPRLRYGSKESLDAIRDAPSPLNATSFITLRFRHHAPLENFKLNRRPKTIIDLQQVSSAENITVIDVHRPIQGECPEAPKRSKGVLVPHSPLTVNHYVGTREQFLFRDDVRKDTGRNQQEVFEQYKDLDFGQDDGMQPWLQGFVNKVGLETAMYLLEGVGEVSY